jgi:hypothetical protein
MKNGIMDYLPIGTAQFLGGHMVLWKVERG